jgi:hypothetical protein
VRSERPTRLVPETPLLPGGRAHGRRKRPCARPPCRRRCPCRCRLGDRDRCNDRSCRGYGYKNHASASGRSMADVSTRRVLGRRRRDATPTSVPPGRTLLAPSGCCQPAVAMFAATGADNPRGASGRHRRRARLTTFTSCLRSIGICACPNKTVLRKAEATPALASSPLGADRVEVAVDAPDVDHAADDHR